MLSGCGNFSSAPSVLGAGALIRVSLTCAPFRVSRRFGQECLPVQVKAPTASCPAHLFLISSCSELEFFQSIKLHRLSSGSCHWERESHSVLLSQHETRPPSQSPSLGRSLCLQVDFCFVFGWEFLPAVGSSLDLFYILHSLITMISIDPLCVNSARKIHLWVHQGFMSPKALELPDKNKIASQ